MEIMPYVGITGITSQSESEALLQLARELNLLPDRRLMVGVLASYKGLVFGQVSDPSQYAPVAKLNNLMLNEPELLNLLHYNSRATGLSDQLIELLGRVPRANGLQLNVPWPDPGELRSLRQRAYAKIVLQLSASAAAQYGGRAERIADEVERYAGLIEMILIDPSGGLGRSFELGYTEDVLGTLVQRGLPMRWGVAGGLGSGELEPLRLLLALYPELSWDAQAKLRTDGRLDLAKCCDYLAESSELLRQTSIAP